MRKRISYLLVFVVIVSILFSGCDKTSNDTELSTLGFEQTDITEQDVGDIYVYVSGEVESPGVYCVDGDARLYQVIAKAGGMTKKAKKDSLNLAETVRDGQEVQVLSKKQYKKQKKLAAKEETKEADGNRTDSPNGLLNINTATVEQFATLPGIGESKASAIVAYREENGNFSSIEEIKNVSGIGDATFSNISAMITVN